MGGINSIFCNCMLRQSSGESSDSSSNSEQYRKIYAKELKKIKDKEKKTAALDRSARDRKQKDHPYSHSRKEIKNEGIEPCIHRARRSSRSRSRSKEKPHQLNWFIYEQCEELNLSTKLDPKIRNLPIFQKKTQIINSIIRNQIVLVTGDTGCGKSTQVPRLIYQYLQKVGNNTAKILCVQPRRLAVLNLQSTLDKQMKETTQNQNHNLIGYQIGMQSYIKPCNRIVFMTNGIFLQRLVHGADFFNEFPFILLDEVHERDIDTDFILMAVKRIVRQYPKVRIVLMSATIDNELFRYYFAADHIDKFLTEENFYKRVIRKTQEKTNQKKSDSDDDVLEEVQDDEIEDQIYQREAFEFMKSRHPCPAINVTDANKFKRENYFLDTLGEFTNRSISMKWGAAIFSEKYPNTHRELYDVATSLIQDIALRHQHDKTNSSILVFLPGLGEIEGLSETITRYFGSERTKQQFEILHVHSAVINEDVTRKLHASFKDKIKIMLATNIAESSITVVGVKYIIDFCLSKEVRFDQKSRMENLCLVWASKASCKQRAGRTGRVCDGIVIRLIEKSFYDKLPDYSTPEIQRSSLDRLILRIKLIHERENDGNNIFEDPGDVLGSSIQPPHLKNIDSAIKSLKFCGGLEESDGKFNLTNLGRLYIEIPIDICYCKMLLVSLLFGTYSDMVILVSILSQGKNAFKRFEIDKKPLEFAEMIENDSFCDFLALINIYKAKTAAISKYQARSQQGRQGIEFEIYHETKQMAFDIHRRFKKLSQDESFFNLANYLHISEQSEHKNTTTKSFFSDEYLQKFKMTIICGFIDKFIVVRKPIYDDKQEKRLKYMKKYNISNKKTIILLNSPIIKKPLDQNQQAEEKLKNHWLQNLNRNLKISQVQLTLGHGLSYLHFSSETDLYKLLFIKYIESNKKLLTEPPRDTSQNRFITTSEMLRCFGDLDYMQEGRISTQYKNQTITTDSYSLNRVVNINEDTDKRFMVSNSFMQQSSRLRCRYSCMIPEHYQFADITMHLLFYPFISVLTDKKNKKYEFVQLRKNYKLKIEYELPTEELQEANQIRSMIKTFFNLGNPNQQEVTDILDNFWPATSNFVRRQRLQHFNEDKWQEVYFKEMKEEFKNKGEVPNCVVSYFNGNEEENQMKGEMVKEEKVFMNEVVIPNLNLTYFTKSGKDYQERLSHFFDWKRAKLQEIRDFEEEATNHNTYLTCGYPTYQTQGEVPCGVKLCKLTSVGPSCEQFCQYREIFDPISSNMHVEPFNEMASHFCSLLMGIYLPKDFKTYACNKGHYFGIHIEGEKRIKILPFSQLMILYADRTPENAEFQKLDIHRWKPKADKAVAHKFRIPISVDCIVCGQYFTTVKELEAHVKDWNHQKNVKDFAVTLPETKVKNNEEDDDGY